MYIHERTPSTATRLGRDPTLLSSMSSDVDNKGLPPPARRGPSRVTPRRLAAITIACLAIAVGCVIFYWGIVHKMRRFQFIQRGNTTPLPTEDPSCCPAFFETLAVEHGRSPCEDFRHYACSRNRSDGSTFHWDTWNAHEALTLFHDHPTALPGRLLHSLHEKCEALLEHGPVQFVKEMTPLVLQDAQLPPSPSNADQTLLLMAYISLKLRVDAPVHFYLPDTVYPTLGVDEKIANLVSSFASFNRTCSECVDEALSLIRDHTGRSVLHEELLDFEVGLEDLPDNNVSSCGQSLFRELGAEVAWDKVCRDIFDVPSSDVRMLCTTRPNRIYAVFKRFAALDTKSVSLASIIVHLLATIFLRLASVDASITTSNPEHRCLFEEDFPNLWTHSYAEVLVTSAKNRYLKDIFANVTTALPAIASAANIVAPEVDATLVEYVKGLSLFLPVRDLPRKLEPPRVTTHNFSAQFLLTKEYEFRLEANRRRRHFPRQLLTGDPVYVSNGWLVVTPLAYALVDVSCELLMDLPVVSVPMAKGVWSYLFDKENRWLVALLRNETGSFSCLHDGNDNLTRRKQALETALALKTALSVFDRREWSRPRNSSAECHNVTASQVFFLRLGDSLCGTTDSSIWSVLNLIFQRDSEFSATFSCPEASTRSLCLRP